MELSIVPNAPGVVGTRGQVIYFLHTDCFELHGRWWPNHSQEYSWGDLATTVAAKKSTVSIIEAVGTIAMMDHGYYNRILRDRGSSKTLRQYSSYSLYDLR